MIIVNLKGGLGNQMFQYAAARRLAAVNNELLKLDLTFLERDHKKPNITLRAYELSALNIQETFATKKEVEDRKRLKNKLLSKLFPAYMGSPYVRERHFHFDPTILNLSGEIYLEGYWMSEKYFLDIQPIIRKEFSFRRKILEEGRHLHSSILESDSVCIQVRRGDYVTNPQIAKIHQTTTLDYFKQAITLMTTKVNNPSFYIFSDDIQWCEQNLGYLKNRYFVEKELSQHGANNSDYLQLMISCRHFIISNSTFAWWAAWLGSFQDKIVIAPKNWFNSKRIITKDIYPAQWIKI